MNETIGLDEGTLFLTLFVFGLCLLCFANGLDCSRKRNDKIDEEEKAKQKMIEEKLKRETEEEEKRLKKHAEKAEAERIRAQSQIWVI